MLMERAIIVTLVCLIIAGSVSCTRVSPRTFEADFGFRAKKITFDEASSLFGVKMPVPTYLPKDYEIQDTYIGVGNNGIILLISDRPIEYVTLNLIAQKQFNEEELIKLAESVRQ